MSNFFSIAIPTYEMKGKGVEYLEHSFQILNNQTFKDFEIIISDHSKSDDIKLLCDKWKDIFSSIKNELQNITIYKKISVPNNYTFLGTFFS